MWCKMDVHSGIAPALLALTLAELIRDGRARLVLDASGPHLTVALADSPAPPQHPVKTAPPQELDASPRVPQSAPSGSRAARNERYRAKLSGLSVEDYRARLAASHKTSHPVSRDGQGVSQDASRKTPQASHKTSSSVSQDVFSASSPSPPTPPSQSTISSEKPSFKGDVCSSETTEGVSEEDAKRLTETEEKTRDAVSQDARRETEDASQKTPRKTRAPRVKRELPPDVEPEVGTPARGVWEAIRGNATLSAMIPRPGDYASSVTAPGAYVHDVLRSVRAAITWIASNPGEWNGRTANTLTAWLNREEDRARSRPAALARGYQSPAATTPRHDPVAEWERNRAELDRREREGK